MPILHTHLNTLETAQRLSDFGNEIPTDDTERAEQVTRFVSSHIDVEWLKQHSNNGATPRLSPSAFRHELVQKSIAAKNGLSFQKVMSHALLKLLLYVRLVVLRIVFC